LAAAEAHLADALARRFRGEDPQPALERMRRAVEAGERANPRYFPLALVRAEGELEAATGIIAKGGTPVPSLDCAARECQRGLRMKSDEARFHSLLARIAVFRAEESSKAGRASRETVREGMREVRQALAICPNQRAALEARKALEDLEGASRKLGSAPHEADRGRSGFSPGS
jgi:hypothetical protein